IRMTKFESPNEIRSSNDEWSKHARGGGGACFVIRASSFVIHSGIRISSFGFQKKNPSAVAGKGSWCFEAQVGAGAKTVGVTFLFTRPGTPGETVGATRPVTR